MGSASAWEAAAPAATETPRVTCPPVDAAVIVALAMPFGGSCEAVVAAASLADAARADRLDERALVSSSCSAFRAEHTHAGPKPLASNNNVPTGHHMRSPAPPVLPPAPDAARPSVGAAAPASSAVPCEVAFSSLRPSLGADAATATALFGSSMPARARPPWTAPASPVPPCAALRTTPGTCRTCAASATSIEPERAEGTAEARARAAPCGSSAPARARPP
mmetsp:Transcript_87660/g.235076  ORF Transcript_87660/g.235076 Transcript_87660/m.235076 type:complete len:221 (-) Transcript_87660:20-682(-)